MYVCTFTLWQNTGIYIKRLITRNLPDEYLPCIYPFPSCYDFLDLLKVNTVVKTRVNTGKNLQHSSES